MKPRFSPGFFLVFSVVLAGVGTGLAVQWLQTLSLRTELEAARTELGELEKLRAENRRLREQQISPAQLEALRADHAALPRLRAEMEALRKE